MATTKKVTQKKAERKPSNANEVDDFMRALEHPRKDGLEAVRKIILGASPTIVEGIKWKSPSFRTIEWFATMNLRANVVQIILHLGAKVRSDTGAGPAISDPARLLKWLARDRASVTFPDLQTITSNQRALADIVRQWIARLPKKAPGVKRP